MNDAQRIADLEAEVADLKHRNGVLLERLAKAHDDAAHAKHDRHRQSVRASARQQAAGG